MEPRPIQNSISIRTLRDEAYRLAEACQTRAARPGATPIDRESAEAAALLILLAERKAELVPASWVKARMQEFRDWCQQRLRTLEAHKLEALRTGSTSPYDLVVEALADVKNEEALLSEQLKRTEWDVWSWACDELTALNAGLTVKSGLRGEG